MERKSLPDLAKSMEGNDATWQWDVVVSYDENKINEILNANPISELEALPVLIGQTKNDDDEDVAYEFNLKLPRPRLQFKSEFGTAALVADLQGTYKKKGSDQQMKDIPPKYQLQIEVQLLNVSGTATSERSPAVRTNYVVDLGEDPKASQSICISFNESKARISQKPPTQEKRLSGTVMDALEDVLGTKFSENIKNHFISGVSRQGEDPAMNVLNPRSFCFTVIPGDSKIPGVLTMWIGVEGGHNNGKRSSGQTNLFFAPDGQNSTSPIPDKCSASIIFSHDIMGSHFFEPNFRNTAGKVNITSTKGTAGMTLTCNLNSGRVKIDPFFPIEKTHDYQTEYKYEGLDFECSDPPAKITVKPELATNLDDAVSISYNSGSRSAKWTFTTYIFRGGPTRWGEGTVLLTFTCKSLGKWYGGTDSQPNLIGLTFKSDQKWGVTAKADNGDRDWLQKLFNVDAKVPGHYKVLEPPAPDIKVEMKGLDYFLTTNILFPGKHVFHAHPLTEETRKLELGLAFPRDLILTGDIKLQ